MDQAGAQNAVTVSALTVGGIYAYRKLIEPSVPAGGKASAATVPPFGRFIVGWGVSFLVIAAIADAAPQFGGWFAILVATSDLLINGAALSADVNTKLASGSTASKAQQKAAVAAASVHAEQTLGGGTGTLQAAPAFSDVGSHLPQSIGNANTLGTL